MLHLKLLYIIPLLAIVLLSACVANSDGTDEVTPSEESEVDLALSSTSCSTHVKRNSGGHIIAHPKIALTWLNAYFWYKPTENRHFYTTALDKFGNDPEFWSRLSEYGITSGSDLGTIDLTYSGAPSSLSEQELRDAMTFRFGNLSHPPDSSTIYVVMLPKGVRGAFDPLPNYLGYHQTYMYKGMAIQYAVIEYNTDTNLTLETISHEIYEAATDPDLRTGYRDHTRPGAPEIGDLCEGQTATIDGYTVQRVWSQNWCGCI